MQKNREITGKRGSMVKCGKISFEGWGGGSYRDC